MEQDAWKRCDRSQMLVPLLSTFLSARTKGRKTEQAQKGKEVPEKQIGRTLINGDGSSEEGLKVVVTMSLLKIVRLGLSKLPPFFLKKVT